MLTRSQARLFFIGGTTLFSLVFLFLTVDTMTQVPRLTNARKLTPAVDRGKQIWEANNCMGCHTILGEGAYYAPELTKAVERRGEQWLKLFLKDPQAMFPGERKMVQYNFTDEQIDDIIAFLRWIGETDLNGFPAKPDLQQPAAAQAPSGHAGKAHAAVEPPAMYNQICSSCHAIGGSGGTVGPALDGIGSRFDADYLDKWLADPQALKPGTTMPTLPMSDAERAELVEFLSTLQ